MNLQQLEELYNEACNYYTGNDGYPLDYEKAFELLLEAANHNHAAAMNMLGNMYEEGDCCDENIEIAFSWFSKAAQQGDALGLYNLGRYYYNGIYVKQDIQKALSLFHRSYDTEENEYAAAMIADHYIETRNYDEAIPLLNYLMYEANFPEAYLTTAFLVEKRKIQGPNPSGSSIKDSIPYYQKAAEMELPEAMAEYGRILWAYGDADAGAKEEGFRWVKRAVDMGYEEAKKLLHKMNTAETFTAIRDMLDKH